MTKGALRERIWDELEERGEARFPYPPHGRIPNFAGAREAAGRLAETDIFQDADAIKSNPDSPQLPVRRAALRQGTNVYMAVPRLRETECFFRLDPDTIDDLDHAATIGGSADVGVQITPETMEPIDVIVSGSVVVNRQGSRVGKGEGYSDLEFAILREFGLVDDDTTTVTTVHELQVVEEAIPTTDLDVPMDLIVTPERTIRTDTTGTKPSGIAWEALDEERLEEIPILQRLE
ncbi:MAG: 5-formyltetrahydrofolate cyclo-ligase [Natronomonas sp.]